MVFRKMSEHFQTIFNASIIPVKSLEKISLKDYVGTAVPTIYEDTPPHSIQNTIRLMHMCNLAKNP
jgi:hypothetical protein